MKLTKYFTINIPLYYANILLSFLKSTYVIWQLNSLCKLSQESAFTEKKSLLREYFRLKRTAFNGNENQSRGAWRHLCLIIYFFIYSSATWSWATFQQVTAAEWIQR